MIQGVLKKIFGSRNERLLKQYGRTVRAINALEPEISRLTDDQLRAKTDEFRKRVQERVAAAAPRGAADATDDAGAAAADSTLAAADEQVRDAAGSTLVAGQDTPVDRARRDALEEILPEAFA